MMRKMSVVLGSLVGALAIHGALIACSSGGTSVRGGGEGTAHADPTNSAAVCTQWEVRTITPKTFNWDKLDYVDNTGTSRTIDMPSIGAFPLEQGWEPFATSLYTVVARRCVK